MHSPDDIATTVTLGSLLAPLGLRTRLQVGVRRRLGKRGSIDFDWTLKTTIGVSVRRGRSNGPRPRRFKLDDVKDPLKAIGVVGMTLTEVRRFGR